MFDTKKQLTWLKLKVGLVVTIGFLVLLATVFFAGGIENLFTRKSTLQASIVDVRGLRIGSPVWIAGIEIGTVRNMALHPQHGTLVTMAVREDTLPYIKKDAKATVQTMGLLGDKYIEITQGTKEMPIVKSGELLEGMVQLEMKDLVREGSASMEKISEFLGKLDVFLQKVESGQGSTGRLISDPSLYNNLNSAAQSLGRIVKEFDESKGSLRMLMKDDKLYVSLTSTAISLDELTKKMTQGSGSFRKMVDDPALYDNLLAASKKLNAVVEKVDSGDGAAAVLLNDKALAKDLKEIVAELKTMTKDIKENPRRYFKFSVF
jgi:phospholipid/cholesterol/gamma-HCH transport system substrate-binding protein